MSIRWRIVLSMVLISFVVIATMGQITMHISETVLQDRAAEFMEAILKRTAYEIGQPVSNVENLVELMDDDMQLLYDHKKVLDDATYTMRFLERFEGTLKLVAGLGVTKSAFIIIEDGYGGVYAKWASDSNYDGVVELMDPIELINRLPLIKENGLDGFQIQSTEKSFWVFDEVTKRYLMCFKPVTYEGRVIGLLGMDLNYESIRNRLASTTYLKSGYLYLLDKTGHVLYHPSFRTGEMYPGLGGLEEMFNKTLDKNGEPGLTGVMSMSNGWKLAIEIKESDIFEGLHGIKRAVLYMMGAAMVLSIILGILAGNQISKPYIYLSHKLDEIGKGNFDVIIDDTHLNRKDEAGLLTRTVDSMRNSQKEINQNLENKVAERTEELVKTNVLLEEVLTQTVEQQEKLVETEKIASLTYLAVGIAHQMNTPIGNSITSASYLDERISDMKRLADSGVIRKSDLFSLLEDGSTSIRSLRHNLDTSRMLVDKFKELNAMTGHDRVETIRLRPFILDEIAIFKERYPRIACVFDVNVDETLEFDCEPKHLQKILYELLDNSYDHGFGDTMSDKKPTISVRITPVHEPTDKGKVIRIVYMDNGVGVEEDIAKKIFTPFFTTKMGRTHYGLGLNLVYNLVVGVFDGDISVEDSESGVAYVMILHEQTKGGI